MRVNGVSLSDLERAPHPDDVAERLTEWVTSLHLPDNRQLIPLAHPWAFEYSFLNAWLGPAMVNDLFHRDARDSKALATGLNDMARLAGKTVPFKKTSLDYLCRHFGVQNLGPHDALWDALAEAEVYRSLLW
jgi:DNA polymerase III epsilon subunit-like protein